MDIRIRRTSTAAPTVTPAIIPVVSDDFAPSICCVRGRVGTVVEFALEEAKTEEVLVEMKELLDVELELVADVEGVDNGLDNDGASESRGMMVTPLEDGSFDVAVIHVF